MLREEALKAYEAREEELGEELTRWLERQILLQIIDNRWREHLYEMDYLREGIHLRGFAQIDPLVAYKNEGFVMFEELMASIWQEFARVIFHVEVNVEPQEQQQAPARGAAAGELLGRHRGRPALAPCGTRPPPPRQALPPRRPPPPSRRSRSSEATASPPGTVVKSEHEKLGRNDPCWCGSGKKFKNCHGALSRRRDERARGWARRPAAVLVGSLGARLRRLPRRGVGAPGDRRPGHLREAHARGVPVGALLAHDPAQAGELPSGVRRVRLQRCCRLRRPRRSSG